MPKLSRRKQSKPQHLSSDDEETTASPSESAKDVIADDNGNIITTRSKARSNKLGNSKLNSPIKSDHCSPKTKNVIEHDRVTGIKDDIREDIQEEKSVNIDSLEENSIDKETVKVIDRVTYSSKTNGKVNKVIFNGISCESEVESSGSGVKVKLRNIHDQGEKMVVSENTEHVAEEQKVIINNYREENNDADDNQYDEISDGASIDPDSDDELKNDGDSLTDACRYDFVDGDTKDSFNSDENSGILDSEADRDLYNTQEENKNADFLGVERNSSGDLQRHMTKHTGERPFICLLCNRGFKAKRSLQYHQFSVHGVEHKNISERYPDIRKRKLEAGELVDDSIITELEQKRMKLDDSTEGEGDTPAVSPVLNGVGEQVKKRVCEICNKVCVKPSDLKRHMMIHTGERPFKCEACGKPFRAKNSMMYHLKSSHGYNIELSPGLEERFLRLKKQTRLGSVMAGLHGEDPMDLVMSGQDDNEKASSNNPALANTKGSIISLSNKKLPLELDPRFHNLPSHMQKKFYSCDLNSFTEGEAELDESSGLFKLKDIGIEFPDPDVLTPTQQDLPSHVVKPGGNLVGKDIVLESKGKRQDLTVKNETVLVTRLDSVLMNGKEVCLYKCYLCGKIFNYFSKVQRHLSLHFEREITTYNCALCDASFWFRHQIYQHIRKKHSKELRQEKSTENNHSTRDEIDSTSNTTLQSDFSNNQETNTLNSSMGHLPEAQSKGSLEGQVLQQYIRALRFRRDTSGTFVCMICRQGFQQEQSILKHIKIHSNHKFSYCNQCGDGFTDYSLLQEHLEHCSDSRNVHSTKLQYPAILNSNMASSSKYGVPDKRLVMMSNSTALYNTPFQKEQLNSFQINREGINLTPVHAESRNSSPPIVIPETVTNAPNSASISDDAKSSLLSHLLKKTTECAGIRSNTSVFGKVQQNCEDLTHPEEEKSTVGENKNSQEEMARALLEQEGIKEDVTVVMPCDPEDIPVNEQTETSEKEDDWSENADTEESQMSEILAAPKRTLMSNLSSKSRRKTSQPMRINHDTEIAANSLLQLNEEPLILPKDVKQEIKSPEVNNHEEEIKTTSPSVAVVNPTLNSSLMKSCSPVPTTSTQESVMASAIPQQNPNLNLLSASEQLAQAIAASGQGKNMTPAFANLSAQALVNAEKLPPVMQALIGAGHFPPSLSQTLSLPAAQPLLQGQIHDSLTQSLNSSAAQVLLAASHLSSPLTQALALQAIHAHINRDSNSAGSSSQESKNSESNSIEKPTSASLTASQQAALLMGGGAATNLALFPGFSAGNIAMNPLTGLPLSVQVSTPDSSSKDREASSASPHSTTNSEKSSTEPSPVDSRDHLVGYPRVQWSPSESGLSNFTWSQISTDGRKVTSLSRTHSRLPIINTPVNREQICKPTTLEDGRQVFRCPFCSKDFLSYSDINRHMDFHEDIRPYKCKYCEYYARTNSQLKVHMMRHQGIREFCCKVCNYKGVTQSDLNRHMKSQIHMLKSRNECSYCGEGFVTTKNLEKHLDGNCIVKVQQEKGEEYLC